MDLGLLKRKISTYRTEGGKLKNVSDELLMEILEAWENWSGPASRFYKAVGVDFRKMATFIGRAKKLKQEGHGISRFKEIKLQSNKNSIKTPHAPIVLKFQRDKIIKFYEVDHLVDFLKKVA